VKKLKCKPSRQKDPMNLNGGALETGGCDRDNVWRMNYKVSKLSLKIWKNKNNGAEVLHLVGATASK